MRGEHTTTDLMSLTLQLEKFMLHLGSLQYIFSIKIWFNLFAYGSLRKFIIILNHQ